MTRTLTRLIIQSIRDIARTPWAQTLTLAAVTMVTFLAGLFILFLFNLNHELLRNRGEVVFQMYWEQSANATLVQEQWKEIRKLPYLSDLTTFTPTQALDELDESLGSDMNLRWLRDDNPIPYTALVSFTPADEDMGKFTANMLSHLQNMDKVDEVHFNPLRTQTASSWANYGHRILWPLIAFLALLLAMVVGNTIRLSMLTRKREIEILNLVGAKRFYIQFPLLFNGALHGFVGSILALSLLKAVQAGLRDILNTPPFFFRLTFLPFDQSVALVGILTAVCVLFSFVAVRN